MTPSKSKSRQWAVGFLIILSLFVSSVSACLCSHHTENFEVKIPSCHETSETAGSSEPDSPENVQKLDAHDECFCVQSAPRVFSKSETIKIEKQTAALPLSQIEIKAVSPVVSGKNIYFEKPFYLTDSARHLKSPRAPPRL